MNKKLPKIEESKSTEVAVVPPEKNNQVELLIAQAIEKGTPVETMEKLLAMRRELKAEWAKEQFDLAMAAFQGECPVIKKEKAGGKTNGGTVAYYYAPLEAIVFEVKDLLKKNGFSYSIQTQTLEAGVKVTCTVKHSAGHKETSDIEVPLGTKTNVMSAPQVVASALTFAKRYAFCNAFGILTGDTDNDANLNTGAPAAPAKVKTAADKLADMIGKATKEELLDYKGKIAASEKYTEDQKEGYYFQIDTRLAELEK